MTASDEHEAKLRSVDFAVIGLIDAAALGIVPSVGFVGHGERGFSVRLRYVPPTTDYRTDWRMVESRPRDRHDERPESVEGIPRFALRHALRIEGFTPRLLGETAPFTPDSERRNQARAASVEQLTFALDGEPVKIDIARYRESFGCRILLPTLTITAFGRGQVESLEFRRVEPHELLTLERYWENPTGF